MLFSLCIKTNNKKILKYLLKIFEKYNFIISRKKFKIYENIIIHSNTSSPYFSYDIFASTLAHVIIKFYEKTLIKKIITFNYFYFSDNEKTEIYNLCLKELDSSRKDLIYFSALEYIKQNNIIILDGFVNFRLSSYMTSINKSIDISVDKFLIKREYHEFTNLLKMYVQAKNSFIDIVNIIYNNHSAILLDKNYNLIPIVTNNLSTKYLSDITFSHNDYVLNTLLTLIPQKIILHSLDNSDEFIKTLELIFENKIQICDSCDLCNNYISNTKFFKD